MSFEINANAGLSFYGECLSLRGDVGLSYPSKWINICKRDYFIYLEHKKKSETFICSITKYAKLKLMLCAAHYNHYLIPVFNI